MAAASQIGLITAFAAYAHQAQHEWPELVFWMHPPVHTVHHKFGMWKKNFGIGVDVWDKVFGTFYDRPDRPVKSETVFNLGYTPEVAKTYPWVSAMSGGVETSHPADAEDVVRVDRKIENRHRGQQGHDEQRRDNNKAFDTHQNCQYRNSLG